jgi:microcystin-dependent protein
MSNIVIPDGGNIGSASDTDAIAISASGAVTFSKDINPNNFVGMIAPFAMTSVPTGWLACDGSAVSKTTYSGLFTALGANAWGTDTTDNFYLPDLEGAFLRGTGSHGTSNMANGNDFAGPSVGSFENDQAQSHGHVVRLHSTNSSTGISLGNLSNATVKSNQVTTMEETTAGPSRDGDETRPFNAGVKYCIKY